MSTLKAGDLALTLVDRHTWPAGSVVTLEQFVSRGTLCEFKNYAGYATFDAWVCVRPDEPNAVWYLPGELIPLKGEAEPRVRHEVDEAHA